MITTACWGIAFSSIHNGVIANNTVVADNLIPAAGCVGANVSVGDKTHAGASSNNTVVRNNLTSQLEITTPASSVTADHNVIILGNVSPELIWYVNGVAQFSGKPGTYMNGNIIDSGGAKSEFVNFNPSTLTYNMMLKAGAPAIGAGTATGAPTVDILGARPCRALHGGRLRISVVRILPLAPGQRNWHPAIPTSADRDDLIATAR